jgi:hypothetical protein
MGVARWHGGTESQGLRAAQALQGAAEPAAQGVRGPCAGLTDRFLAQPQGTQLGRVAQTLVFLGMQGCERMGIHGGSFQWIG